jgi:hypothetical protein
MESRVFCFSFCLFVLVKFEGICTNSCYAKFTLKAPVATFSKVHSTHLRLFSLPAPYLFPPVDLKFGILKCTERVQVSEAVLGSIGI